MPSITSFIQYFTIDELQVLNDTVRVIQPLIINLILYGNEDWNTETNLVLFRAFHRYYMPQNAFDTVLDSNYLAMLISYSLSL